MIDFLPFGADDPNENAGAFPLVSRSVSFPARAAYAVHFTLARKGGFVYAPRSESKKD